MSCIVDLLSTGRRSTGASEDPHLLKKFSKLNAFLFSHRRISFSKLEDVDEVERQRQDELDIKCLQILRAIIHNEIMLIDPGLRENNPSAFRKYVST